MNADFLAEAKELPSSCVFFVPISEDTMALMLPILPPSVVYGDDQYRDFLEEFLSVRYELRGTREDPVGRFWVEHRKFSFHSYALEPFVEAIARIGEVLLVPYCVNEGFPKQDVMAAKVPVMENES